MSFNLENFHSMGFLKEKPDIIAKFITKWLNCDSIIIDNLENAMFNFFPLSMPMDKIILIPACHDWTALLFNRNDGFGESGYIEYCAMSMGIAGVYVTYIDPNYIDQLGQAWPFPACMLSVFNMLDGNRIVKERIISVIKDGSRWAFDEFGEYFSFENMQIYQSKMIKSRFTKEMLMNYLAHFQIDYFNENFLLADQPVILVLKKLA